MASEQILGLRFQWERYRFATTLALLCIVYGVGTVGILSPYSELFVKLTFANLILTAALLLSNAAGFGVRGVIAFALSMGAGFFVELLGVKTGAIFGSYYYTDRLGPRLFDVPLVIGLNWALLVHATHAWLSERIHSRTIIAAVGATAMTAFDWVMEPVATRLRFWLWQADVPPLRNYVAWWSLSFLLLLASDRISPRPKNRLARWVLAVMLLFFATVGVGVS